MSCQIWSLEKEQSRDPKARGSRVQAFLCREEMGKENKDVMLVELIFSWSLEDIFNEDLFKDKVFFINIFQFFNFF